MEDESEEFLESEEGKILYEFLYPEGYTSGEMNSKTESKPSQKPTSLKESRDKAIARIIEANQPQIERLRNKYGYNILDFKSFINEYNKIMNSLHEINNAKVNKTFHDVVRIIQNNIKEINSSYYSEKDAFIGVRIEKTSYERSLGRQEADFKMTMSYLTLKNEYDGVSVKIFTVKASFTGR